MKKIVIFLSLILATSFIVKSQVPSMNTMKIFYQAVIVDTVLEKVSGNDAEIVRKHGKHPIVLLQDSAKFIVSSWQSRVLPIHGVVTLSGGSVIKIHQYINFSDEPQFKFNIYVPFGLELHKGDVVDVWSVGKKNSFPQTTYYVAFKKDEYPLPQMPE